MPEPKKRAPLTQAQRAALRKSMEALRAKYHGQDIMNALWETEFVPKQKKAAGRRKSYGDVELEKIWLFVQQGINETKLTTEAYCRKASFTWPDWDARGKFKPVKISGATLRRRYQEAVVHLKAKHNGPLEDLRIQLHEKHGAPMFVRKSSQK